VAEFENKFIVINRKYLEDLRKTRPNQVAKFEIMLDSIMCEYPRHKYYVCNQDEPYSEKVIKTILDGEDAKRQSCEGCESLYERNNQKMCGSESPCENYSNYIDL